MLRLALVVGISLAITTACDGSDAPHYSPPSNAVLDDLRERYGTSDADFSTARATVVSTSSANGTTQRDIWWKNGEARVEISGDVPYGMCGWQYGPSDLLMWSSDGSYEVSRPKEEYAETGRWPMRFDYLIPFGPIGTIDAKYVKRAEDETIAGRTAVKLVIETSGQILWLDSVYGVILKYEYRLGENVLESSEFESIEFNEELDDSLFDTSFLADYEEACRAVPL